MADTFCWLQGMYTGCSEDGMDVLGLNSDSLLIGLNASLVGTFGMSEIASLSSLQWGVLICSIPVHYPIFHLCVASIPRT